jgi:hypothetical protein
MSTLTICKYCKYPVDKRALLTHATGNCINNNQEQKVVKL